MDEAASEALGEVGKDGGSLFFRAPSRSRAPLASGVSPPCASVAPPHEERALRDDFELIVRGYYRQGRAAELTGTSAPSCRSAPRGATPIICVRPTTPRGGPCASASTASTCAPPSLKRFSVAPPDVKSYLFFDGCCAPTSWVMVVAVRVLRDQRPWLRR